MKRDELIKTLSEKSGLTNAQAREAISILVETISQELENGDAIEIGGFGKLEVKERAERQGVNPNTQERITIPASRNISFKAAKALKERVNKR